MQRPVRPIYWPRVSRVSSTCEKAILSPSICKSVLIERAKQRRADIFHSVLRHNLRHLCGVHLACRHLSKLIKELLEPTRLTSEYKLALRIAGVCPKVRYAPWEPDAFTLLHGVFVLTEDGLEVQCVLKSKWGRLFYTPKGSNAAALFRTDHGDFELLLLPKPFV